MSSDSPPKSKLRKFFHSSGPIEHSINLASLKENAKSAWHGFKLTSKNVEKFLDGTPLKIPVGVINALIALVDAVIDNHDSMAILLLPIGQRLHIVSTSLEQKRRPRGIDSTCKRFIDVLTNTANELETLKEQGLFKRIFESAETPKQLKDIFRRVDEATKNFELELTLATVREVEGIVQNTEIIRLRDLKPCHEAKYAAVTHDSCVQGTREAIIESVLSWSRDPDSPPIFWLSGMAGTGKSTIAYTICSRLYDEGNASQRLGGSFFCSRQIEARRSRRNIIPTIAYDLAHSFPPFGRALLTSKFDAQPPPLRGHIRSLLSDPWRSVSTNQNLPPLVVVIDALDELEKGEGTDCLEDLIKEITQHQEGFRGLKFFVTSRQDPHIVDVCTSIPPNAVYRLETADATVVEQDITLYLRTKLPTLEELQVKILANHASGLFIYAATVIRFVVPKPRANPDLKRVKMLLEAWPDQSLRGPSRLLIDQLYEEILIEWISSDDMSVIDQELAFSILQTVMLTEEPVLISDIPQLMKECDVQVEKVEDVIRSLHAVLFVSNYHIYSYHKSFADFMLDHTRLTKQELTSIIPPLSDRQGCLTTSCFRLMESLRFNICDLPSSFLDDCEVENLQQRIDEQIPTALRYACRHWATHFSKTSPNSRDQIMEIFLEWQEQRLLFWIEGMNLIKVVGECYPLLVKARRSLGPTIATHHRENLMAGHQ